MKMMRLLLVLLLSAGLLAGCAAPAAEESSDEPTSQQTSDATAETETESESGSEAAPVEEPAVQSTEDKVLVAYFSCTGNTGGIAEMIAQHTDADLYQITPEEPYTSEDLNYGDSSSRTSMEQNDPEARPVISDTVDGMESYDTVFIGYPIWWYVAPTIINTFLESYDFSGKTILPFATSGGSGLGQTVGKLKPSASDSAVWKEGRLLNGRISADGIVSWIMGLGL